MQEKISEEFKRSKKNLEGEMSHKDRRGGFHGGDYTKTMQVEPSIGPALNEIRNRFVEKKSDKPSQKACKKLFNALEIIGFKKEFLSHPEFTHNLLLKDALERLYSVNMNSLASASAFYTSKEFKYLEGRLEIERHDHILDFVVRQLS